MDTCYFTVCTRNHLVQAYSLYSSLMSVSPGAKFYCLIIDADLDEDRGLLSILDFEVVLTEQLQVTNLNKMKIYYDAFELSNALKAEMMRYLLFQKGYSFAVYLDTDIIVFNPLDSVVEGLENHSFGFSPHFTSALPDDGLYPDDKVFLKSGIYNGGFWIFKKTKQSQVILNWLTSASVRYGFNDQSNGMFVDQKLICQAAGMFNVDFYPINHCGCNVAYWNLHERLLSYSSEGFQCNLKKLLFFHYSGYRIGENRLSIHTNRFSKLNEESIILQEVVKKYEKNILNSHLGATCNIPYRYNTYNGKRLSLDIRRSYFKGESLRKSYIARAVRKIKDILIS